MPGSELRRRITAVEQRIDFLDQHGTRGVDGLRTTINDQSRTIGKIESGLAALDTKIDGMKASRGAMIFGFIVAVAPLYVLLFLAFAHITTGG